MITSEFKPRRYTCRRHHTRARRHGRFLEWSKQTISFGQEDAPGHIISPGRMPQVSDPLIAGCRFSKVLMDGGSGINVLYVSTLHRMGIRRDVFQPSSTEFHGIVPANNVAPIGQITLEVIFGVLDNYRCELLCFEIVPFQGGYEAILGRTAFTKFMAIPCYAYMKLKMPGPYGVITINGSPLHALEAEATNLDQIKECTAVAEATQPPGRRLFRHDWGRRPPQYHSRPRPCTSW